MVESRGGYLSSRVCPHFAREYRNSDHLALPSRSKSWNCNPLTLDRRPTLTGPLASLRLDMPVRTSWTTEALMTEIRDGRLEAVELK